MEMVGLRPSCCCRPWVAQNSITMAGTFGVPVMVSCAFVGPESREARATFLSRCTEKQNLAGWWNDFKRSERWHVVMARRGGGRSAGEPRSSNSRGTPKPDEPSRNSSAILRKKTHKEIKPKNDGWEENEFDEDALEALFAQLETDLEAGGTSDVEDLSEEEVIELENELAAALRDIEEDEEELRTVDVAAGDTNVGAMDDDLNEDAKFLALNGGTSGGQTSTIKIKDQFADAILEEYEDEVDEQRVVTLEPWQLRKLVAAVQIGRRKVNIKALCAEVGMDRFDVLAWLKNPPPELLMYSATMENEESAEMPEDDAGGSSPAILNRAGKEDVGPEPEGGQNWHSQKRLRKEHEATFERVFSNTDRPSNAIIQNLVELTHVPRKRIVEWFDQRRKVVRVSPKFEALR